MDRFRNALRRVAGWEARGRWTPALRRRRLMSAFDQWSREGRGEAMAGRHRWMAEAVFARLGLRPNDRVLEVGCGSGWASRMAAEQVGSEGFVLGVDISGEMVARARMAAQARHLRYLHCRVENVPWSAGAFSHAFSIETFYYCEQRRTLAEMRRLLLPNGRLCLALCFYGENTAALKWKRELGLSTTLRDSEGYRQLLEREGWRDVSCEEVVGPKEMGAAHGRALLICARS